MNRHRRTFAALATLALAGSALVLSGGPASASSPSVSAVKSANAAKPPAASVPTLSPPGANDFTCKPTAAHPDPVVLVPGTFESMVKNWSTLSPILKQAGYCVYALDYGVTYGVPATGPIAASAKELKVFVDKVLASTRARKVDIVGHSQGGMMPRYYLAFLGGAKKVNHLVGIAPSNHGTQGVITPAPGDATGTGTAGFVCQACADQSAGSAFLTTLNSRGDTVKGVYYTVLSTRYDEVVTPFQSQFLAGAATQVTNITLQDACPLDVIDHDQTPNDPVVHQWVLNALSKIGAPADAGFRPACL